MIQVLLNDEGIIPVCVYNGIRNANTKGNHIFLIFNLAAQWETRQVNRKTYKGILILYVKNKETRLDFL